MPVSVLPLVDPPWHTSFHVLLLASLSENGTWMVRWCWSYCSWLLAAHTLPLFLQGGGGTLLLHVFLPSLVSHRHKVTRAGQRTERLNVRTARGAPLYCEGHTGREWVTNPRVPPPHCISYAPVQATVGVGTVVIVYVILIAYKM